MVSSFTWAHDQVVVDKVKTKTLKDKQLSAYFSVSELFKQLFKDTPILNEGGPSIYHPKASPRKPFKEVFKDAMMRFNHLIKLCDQKGLKRSNLLFFMVRGVAALGTNCQPGFDAVYLYGGTDLDIDKCKAPWGLRLKCECIYLTDCETTG